MPSRQDYYAMIHMGAARLGLGEDADYRAWLENQTGKRSCKDCTDQELANVVDALRHTFKALDNPRLKRVRGGQGEGNRPSTAQWNMADKLCRRLGMSGCNDARFAAFVKRNAKLDHPRFLTTNSMQPLIAALNKWLHNVETKEKQNG